MPPPGANLTKRTQFRPLALVTPLLAFAFAVVVIEAIVVPLGVFVPAEFHDRHVTLYGLFEPDPTLGFHARPNLRHFEVSWMQNSLHASYDTDEYGFRNVGRAYDAAEIVFVGDSFTWGSWLPREKTFPDLLAAQLRKPIANLAQESYYIEQYEKVVHLLFEKLLRQGRPRYIALCLFANDLTTPISDDDLRHFYERFGWDQYRRFPLYQRFFVYRASRFLADSAGRLAIAAGLRPAPPPSHLDRNRTAAGVELYRQLGAHPYYFSESYNLNTEAVLRRLLQYIRDKGVTPLVFLLPSKESAYKEEYLRLFPGGYLEIEETGYHRLCAVASSLDVACADLTPAFRQATRSADTYFRRDPHWNEQGHRLAANELEKHFREFAKQ
jgi:lysophospholipase L1-like esterase